LSSSRKEGEQGRKIINQYTRYGTVLLGTVQAYGIAVGLESGNGIVTDPGWFFRIATVITLVGGTMFLMWLGEQITARGIGNGISLIIFAGIVAALPGAIAGTLELGRTGALSTGLIIAVIIVAIAVIAFIVFIERAQRQSADPVSQAPGWLADVPGRHLAPAAQAQHGRCDSADLCFLACCCCRRHLRALPTPENCRAGQPPCLLRLATASRLYDLLCAA
jgi:hypothetical protein